MNILILGTGFLGYNLAIGFQESDYQVCTVDKNHVDFKFIKHHVRNIKRGIDDILDEQKPNVVYLLINESHMDDSNVLYFLNLDLYDIIKLIQSCIDKGVSKFIIASNANMSHDDCNSCNHLNKYQLTTLNPRDINKFALEMYLQFFKKKYDIDYVSLRISNAYGFKKYDFWQDNIIDTLINFSLKNKTLTIDEHEENLTNILYVGDVVSALILSLREEVSGIYNVFGNYTSFREIVTSISRFTNNVRVNFKNVSKNVTKNNNFRMNGLQQYNWSPIVSLQTGINATFNHIIKRNDF